MIKDKMLFSIDPQITYKFRQQVPERQRSQVVEKLMIGFVGEHEDYRDEQELIIEQEKLKNDMINLREQLSLISSKLEKVKQENQQQKKKQIDEAVKAAQTIRNTGLLHEVKD